MRCLRTLSDGSTAIITVYWKVFQANCPKLNQLCSSTSKAYVPAVTVCSQSLHTGSCDDVAMLC